MNQLHHTGPQLNVPARASTVALLQSHPADVISMLASANAAAGAGAAAETAALTAAQRRLFPALFGQDALLLSSAAHDIRLRQLQAFQLNSERNDLISFLLPGQIAPDTIATQNLLYMMNNGITFQDTSRPQNTTQSLRMATSFPSKIVEAGRLAHLSQPPGAHFSPKPKNRKVSKRQQGRKKGGKSGEDRRPPTVDELTLMNRSNKKCGGSCFPTPAKKGDDVEMVKTMPTSLAAAYNDKLKNLAKQLPHGLPLSEGQIQEILKSILALSNKRKHKVVGTQKRKQPGSCGPPVKKRCAHH